VQGLDNRWAAATVGSFTTSSLELKTGASVMAIGGFTGGDDSPTLAQFRAYVADHEIRYFIEGERFGPPGHRGGSGTDITAWVQENFTPIHVGDATVYDLSAPTL
jgi:4-amino-4-deoxy-L-arabinose transferase-like glycosyltransferase